MADDSKKNESVDSNSDENPGVKKLGINDLENLQGGAMAAGECKDNDPGNESGGWKAYGEHKDDHGSIR